MTNCNLVIISLVAVATFSSCKERSAIDASRVAASKNVSQSAVIKINGAEVYHENYIMPPEQMIEMFNKYTDEHIRSGFKSRKF
jgi:hypothetical protein